MGGQEEDTDVERKTGDAARLYMKAETMEKRFIFHVNHGVTFPPASLLFIRCGGMLRDETEGRRGGANRNLMTCVFLANGRKGCSFYWH